MSDALLPYYDRELNAIRRLAADFANAHPKIAGRLRLTPDAVDDPHVARLLEGTAFLAARVHHRLDDEFPELTDALLGVLYPHYLAPIPSAAILQFEPQPDLALPVRLVSGIALETEPVRGEPCRFQTAWPLTLWPIEIESVRLSGLPLPPLPTRLPAAPSPCCALYLNALQPTRVSPASVSTVCASSCAARLMSRCRYTSSYARMPFLWLTPMVRPTPHQ